MIWLAKKNNLLFPIICVGLIFLMSCAQIVMPSGGEKDKTPPAALSYSPDSASLNFNSKIIEITFDEYIALSGVDQQLVVSPPLEKKPKVSVKGKSLLIELDKDELLKENTTYTFNFGNALKDVNEGNVKENFKYLFSTGDFIDSLSVKGNVLNAFNHQKEKGILVMLYSDFEDSIVYKSQPHYFSKTNENGDFQIDNIHNDNYKIIALKDENMNYLYETGKEKIAFLADSIDVSNSPLIELEMFQEPEEKLFIKKRVYNSFGKMLVVFNKPVEGVKVKSLKHEFDNNGTIVELSKSNDSLTYWFVECKKDSLIIELSKDTIVIDTLELELKSKEEFLKDKKNPLELKLDGSPNGNQKFDLDKNVVLFFTNPIDSINPKAKLELLIDSVAHTSTPVSFTKGSNSQNVMLGPLDLQEQKNYQLFIPPNTFTDIFGLSNDSIFIDFKTQEKSYYGTLALNINFVDSTFSKCDSCNYIIQLLTKNENIVRESAFKPSENILFEYLHPQKYILKIIVDENKNGKWDTGNYLKRQQAEKVIYYNEEVNIRSNWDLEVNWQISK